MPSELPEIYTHKHQNGETVYKRGPTGIYYHLDIPETMIKILESIRLSGKRVRFHWGDTKTGLDWGDVYDVAGTLSNSMGPLKIPILIHSRRSMGGGHILDNCIVKITTTRKPIFTIYIHPNYHTKEGT